MKYSRASVGQHILAAANQVIYHCLSSSSTVDLMKLTFQRFVVDEDSLHLAKTLHYKLTSVNANGVQKIDLTEINYRDDNVSFTVMPF